MLDRNDEPQYPIDAISRHCSKDSGLWVSPTRPV